MWFFFIKSDGELTYRFSELQIQSHDIKKNMAFVQELYLRQHPM